jgi:hypothetical protein
MKVFKVTTSWNFQKSTVEAETQEEADRFTNYLNTSCNNDCLNFNRRTD